MNANTIEVWRGLSVDRTSELDFARLVEGDRLSPRRHRWWTTKKGVAAAYALTGNGVPVLLRATLTSTREFTTPCLPELRPDERLTLIDVTFL